jgi:hypothetical protein
MNLNDNIYALSRWNQDIMNNFDEDADEDRFDIRTPSFE